jgi:predicted NUDIX family NTP pyrophosphohydrolase
MVWITDRAFRAKFPAFRAEFFDLDTAGRKIKSGQEGLIDEFRAIIKRGKQ